MLRFTFQRLVAGIVTLLAISVIVFAATEILPGDVATAVLGRDATPEAVGAIRARLDLDEPAPNRYGKWLWGMIQGDPGDSLASGAAYAVYAPTAGAEDEGVPVAQLIGPRLKNTAMLALPTILILVPLSLLLGTWSAVRRDSIADRLISNANLILSSVPEFVTGTMLVLFFAVVWGVLPAVSIIDPSQPLYAQWTLLVLPITTLLASMLAQTTRMVRAGVLQILDAEYVQMARLKGLSEREVLRRYVLRNSLSATIQVYAISAAWLFGGIVVVESVFQYPGIGLALVDAVNTRDIPVVQAISVIIAVGYVAVNFLADLTTVFLTPKLRSSL